MNNDKKNQIKHNLEIAKQQLEELKEKNPNGNYDYLESMIEKMNALIDTEKAESSMKILLKLLLFFVLAYLFCTISVAVVFGFAHSLINPIPPIQFVTIIPLTSLVLFVALRILNFISNKSLEQPLFSMLLFGIVVIVGFAFLDNLFLHICSSLDKSLCMSMILCIIATLVDLFVTQKIYFKM